MDGLPSQVCGKCFNKLKDAYSFRTQCFASYDFLKALKLNHDKENELYSNSNEWFVRIYNTLNIIKII